jgi:hypothetical protein
MGNMLPYSNGDATGFIVGFDIGELPIPAPAIPIIPPRWADIPKAAASVALGVGEPNIPGSGKKPIPIVMSGKAEAEDDADDPVPVD